MTTSKKVSKSYNELNHELQAILQDMQREDKDIDAAMKDYERGLQIIHELEEYLKSAENKIVQLSADSHDT